MMKNYKAFEKFLSDGGVFSPDNYYENEPENFSPEGVVSVAYINSFARRNSGKYEFAKIA